jgi:hypothetical protein
MATVGRLAVILNAKTKDFEKGMQRARKGTSGMSSALKSLRNILIGGAIIQGFRSIIGEIDELGKTSQKLGIGVEALQALELAGKQSGVEINQVRMGIQRMTRRIAEAAQGTGEAVKALNELGLSAEALAAMSPDQQFQSIADAMAGVANQSDKVRLGFKLFDAEGVALINTLDQLGQQSLTSLEDELRASGALLSEEMVAKVEEANTKLGTLATKIKGQLAVAFADLAPLIMDVVDGLAGLLNKVVEFMNSSAVQGFQDLVAAAMINVQHPGFSTTGADITKLEGRGGGGVRMQALREMTPAQRSEALIREAVNEVRGIRSDGVALKY